MEVTKLITGLFTPTAPLLNLTLYNGKSPASANASEVSAISSTVTVGSAVNAILTYLNGHLSSIASCVLVTQS